MRTRTALLRRPLDSRSRLRPADTFLVALALTALAPLAAPSLAQQDAAEPPRPVRHDTPRAGEEFLVLRHQALEPGTHDEFYRLSRDGVWPLFEEIGTRIVGQWQVIGRDGSPLSAEQDEGYRLARYRSFNHWRATRNWRRMTGDGDDSRANEEALRARRELLRGSKEVVYLVGHTASATPRYFPPLDEEWELVAGSARDAPASEPHPVRHQAARPGQEILVMYRSKIQKGTFPEVHRLSRDFVWPYFEKMGARIVGQWREVFPRPEDFEGGTVPPNLETESPELDEVVMMIRYASVEHFDATRPDVMHRLGGNGRDYEACLEALRKLTALTYEASSSILRGHMYHSPPIFLPSKDERYRLKP